MTETRKRAALDIGDFKPKSTDVKAVADDIGREAGFSSRKPVPERPQKAVRRSARVPLEVPEEVRDWLRRRAFDHDTTVRSVILEGLRAIGAPIDEEDLVDRRRQS